MKENEFNVSMGIDNGGNSVLVNWKESFLFLAELGNEAVMILDEDNRIQFANRKAYEITGYKKDNIMGKAFPELFGPEMERKIGDLLRSSMYVNPGRYSSETRIVKSNGEKVDVEFSFSRTKDMAGRWRTYCFLRDITSKRQMEREIIQSNIRLIRITEMGDDGIMVFDNSGIIRFANQMASQITGFSVDKLIGMEFKALLDDAGKEFLDQMLLEAHKDLSKRICTQLKIVTVEGEKRDTEVCIATGEVSRGTFNTYAYIRDISERMRIENELRKTNEFLKNVIKSSVDGIIAADMKGNIIIFNEGAERLLKYRADEVIGKIHITSLYPPGQAKEIMRKLRSDQHGPPGKLETTQTFLIDREGQEIPVNISAAIVYEGEKEIASVGIFTDLRERIRMQEKLEQTHLQLIQSEKLASLGKLAAGVAHEINNPLGGILMYATMMLEDLPPGDPRAEDLKQIIEQSLRCKEIVKELLEFARQTGKEKTMVNLNRSLDQALSLLKNQAIFHNIQIVKEFDPDLPQIMGDSSQLNQVFINLIVNAVDAMEGKGVLKIKTFYDRERDRAFVSFQDTGCGIPDEHISRIFDPFFTTKAVGKGTGLGLSTSYGIIERHGGRIHVQSKVNRGTTFTIELPIETPGQDEIG